MVNHHHCSPPNLGKVCYFSNHGTSKSKDIDTIYVYIDIYVYLYIYIYIHAPYVVIVQ